MYSEILFHVIFGWAFWDEIMAPASWLGGALIVAGSIMLMVFKPKGINQDTHHHSLRGRVAMPVADKEKAAGKITGGLPASSEQSLPKSS